MSINTILNWEKFEPKFGKWSRFIKPFFDEGGFDPIYQQLKQDTKEGHVITPKSENTFRFLEKVDPDNLKCIIIGMDSYPSRYRNGEFQATGIAFDCSNSPDGKIQPSLEAMYGGLERDLGITIKRTSNLNYLCEQGVMLANRGITCKLEKTGSHIELWNPFWQFFLEDVVCVYFPGIPFVLLGKDAQQLKRHIFAIGNPIFELAHPSYAARNDEPWETKGVFSAINKIVKDNNTEHIYWDEDTYSVPF